MSSVATFIGPDRAERQMVSIPEAFSGKLEIPPGTQVLNTKYMVPLSESDPEAFRAEFPAPTTTAAHFHEIDQFQLFLPGTGTWYQRHELGDLMVHYSDAYSLYGPFGSLGPEQLRFFTLRARASRFAGYLPGDQDMLTRGGTRQYKVAVPLPERANVGISQSEIVPLHPDGLACSLFSAGPHEEFSVPPSEATFPGSYACVVQGSLTSPVPIMKWSLAWVPGGQELGSLRAGSDGSSLLIMHFPTEKVGRSLLNQ